MLALLSTGIVLALLGVVIQYVFRHLHLRRKIHPIFVTGLILFVITCSSIYYDHDDLMGNFYLGIAEGKQDSRICNIFLSIRPTIYVTDPVSYCYERAGGELNSNSINCENVRDAERKGRCYGKKATRLAQEENFEAGVAVCANLTGVVADYCFLWSLDTCDRIVNKELQTTCFNYKFQREINNLEECANNTPEMADLCYNAISGGVKYGSVPCTKIINEELKQECLERTSGS